MTKRKKAAVPYPYVNNCYTSHPLCLSQIRRLYGEEDWSPCLRSPRRPRGGQAQNGDDSLRLLDGSGDEESQLRHWHLLGHLHFEKKLPQLKE